MKCTHVQTKLLSLPDVARVPEALQAHLDRCPGCLAWHRSLVQVEALLPMLPVPPSDGQAKAELLRRLHDEPLAVSRPTPAQSPMEERSAWRWLPVSAIAATILIGAVAFLSLGGRGNTAMAQAPPDPLLESVVQHNVALATADTPADRVEQLAQLAGELHQEMLDLAMIVRPDDLKDLNELHNLYEGVVGGVTEQAGQMHGPNRKEILKRIAAQLALAGQEAESRANFVPLHSKRPMRDLATAARKGSDSIQKLVSGRT